MGLIVKIAFRNLFRHRGRSLVIGAILLCGALIMVLGNSIITGMEKGFETNIVQNWTGHIIIVSARQKNDDPLFSAKPMKVIQNYNRIETLLKNNPDVSAFLPAAKGLAMVLNIGEQKKTAELPILCMLLGVDFQAYRKMFNNNITIIEGRVPDKDEKGLLVNSYEREKIYESENIWILPVGNQSESARPAKGPRPISTGSNLVLMGIGDENSAFDVFADVKGIYQFKSLNLLFKEINIIDLESFRECFEYVTQADGTMDISSENLEILDETTESFDQYFTNNSLFSNRDFEKDLGTDSLKKDVAIDGMVTNTNKGAYNLVFVKLSSGNVLDKSLDALNKSFKKTDADARALSWEDAIGYISDISLLFRIALNIFVFFIFFVAVIIIINTLSMTAMERIPEIGTMRAIGARKSVIAKMFITETCLLSLIFGGAGLVIGSVMTFCIAGLDIPASNEMMSLAFGGDTFRPLMDLQSIGTVCFQLGCVSIAALLYPVRMAKKISPVDAIARD